MKKTYTPGPQMMDCLAILSNRGPMRGYIEDINPHKFFRTMALTDKGRELIVE